VVAATDLKDKINTSLTEENFNEFCQTFYFNPECNSKEEYNDDIKRIKYIKRLLQKIHKHKTLKSIRERLIINHLIILKNVFGDEKAARILFFKLEPRLHSYLKSFLIFLSFEIKNLPEIEYQKLNTDPRVDRKLSLTEN
jgi:hypothetical protein